MNQHSNKENTHPNLPKRNKIIEQDFNSISKQYVLQGQRLKVKSFIYKDEKKNYKKQSSNKPKPQEIIPFNIKNMTQQDIKKLQYLQQMGVINQQQQQILNYIRFITKRESNLIPKTVQNKSKNIPSINVMRNTPAYNDLNLNPQYYGQNIQYSIPYNQQLNGPSQRQGNNFASNIYMMPNPQKFMPTQNMMQLNEYGMNGMNGSPQMNVEMSQQSYY